MWSFFQTESISIREETMKSTITVAPGQFGLVILTAGVALLLSILLLAASASQPGLASSGASPTTTVDPSTHVITVGFAGDLNSWGLPQLYAVQLAISQTNAAGGVLLGGVPYHVALAVADDQGDSNIAVTAAEKLVAAGAVAVVGHTHSACSIAAQPTYQIFGVSMVSASSTKTQLTQLGYTTTFRTAPTDATPPRLLAEYFTNRLGLKKSAIVDMNTWPSSLPGDVYSETFTSLGGEITSRVTLTSNLAFTATLNAIKLGNPDVIFFGGDDPSLAGQFSQIAFSRGMTTILIGWNSSINDEAALATYTTAAGAQAAEGDYAAMEYVRLEDMTGWPRFLSDYLAAGYSEPAYDSGTFSAYAYDATNIILDAVRRAGSADKNLIRQQIAATKNYKGVVGLYQGFNAHGDVIPQWSFLEYNHNGLWTIVPPARLFLPALFR
jgi:branched-chain amino acid transport system substrate-binding protein